MAKRKTYTAAEMRDIKARLIERRGYLASAAADKLTEFLRSLDRETAYAARDMAQQLCTVNVALTCIDTCIQLAEFKGEPQVVPHLEDCGLED